MIKTYQQKNISPTVPPYAAPPRGHAVQILAVIAIIAKPPLPYVANGMGMVPVYKAGRQALFNVQPKPIKLCQLNCPPNQAANPRHTLDHLLNQ
jgi:hypothetical protein